MEITQDKAGRFVIVGKMWMVQRTDLKSNEFVSPASIKVDTHGNPRLQWPGGSVFESLEKAQSVRDILAEGSPEFTFIVMESQDE